jgi:hypothetical protein
MQGRIQDFQLGGGALKNLRRVEGGANIFGVFRVKNHDFTPKNHIFSNFRGAGGARCAPPLYPPLYWIDKKKKTELDSWNMYTKIMAIFSISNQGPK